MLDDGKAKFKVGDGVTTTRLGKMCGVTGKIANILEGSPYGVLYQIEIEYRDRENVYYYSWEHDLVLVYEHMIHFHRDQSVNWRKEGKCPSCGELGRYHLSVPICSLHGAY